MMDPVSLKIKCRRNRAHQATLCPGGQLDAEIGMAGWNKPRFRFSVCSISLVAFLLIG